VKFNPVVVKKSRDFRVKRPTAKHDANHDTRSGGTAAHFDIRTENLVFARFSRDFSRLPAISVGHPVAKAYHPVRGHRATP
jgi:hypothetical protein